MNYAAEVKHTSTSDFRSYSLKAFKNLLFHFHQPLAMGQGHGGTGYTRKHCVCPHQMSSYLAAVPVLIYCF